MATLRKPTRPSFKAMPKAPKMSASDDTWKNYEKRVMAVIAENQKRKAEYDKKLRAYDASIKMRENIKEKAKKAKARL